MRLGGYMEVVLAVCAILIRQAVGFRDLTQHERHGPVTGRNRGCFMQREHAMFLTSSGNTTRACESSSNAETPQSTCGHYTARSTDEIRINRAPVLMLWAAVVVQRLGFDRGTALTLGQAVAGLSAYDKSTSLMTIEPRPELVSEQSERLAEVEQLRVDRLTCRFQLR